MNGCVIANTPIAVDFWKVRECPHAKLFFLTHLHGDHIAGLTSSWHYPIYCSEITGRLLRHKYELKEEFIKVLEIRSPSIVFLDREQKEQLTVTALDANHCPGAVMFLFEGYFGRILHTGDFRFMPQMLDFPPLSFLSGKIDAVFLDNTYCSPKCVFPDRDQATDMILDIIKSHPDHKVVIGMRNLGKEDMLCKIAFEMKTWISVPASIFRTLEILEVHDVFRNSCPDCWINVVPFHRISNKFVNKLNEEVPTIAILPTALYCGIDAEPYINQDKVFVVPYSDHSSYPELQEFVAGLRPSSVIPVVKSKSRGPFGVNIDDRADMSCFQDLLSGNEKRAVCVPMSVKSFMNNHRIHPVINGKPHNIQKRKSLTKSMKTNKQRGIKYDTPSKELTPSGKTVVHDAKCGQVNMNGINAHTTDTVENIGTHLGLVKSNLSEHFLAHDIDKNIYEDKDKTVRKQNDFHERFGSCDVSGIHYGDEGTEDKRNGKVDLKSDICSKISQTPTKRNLCNIDDNPITESTCHKKKRTEKCEYSESILIYSQGVEVSNEILEISDDETKQICEDSSPHQIPEKVTKDLGSVIKFLSSKCNASQMSKCFESPKDHVGSNGSSLTGSSQKDKLNKGLQAEVTEGVERHEKSNKSSLMNSAELPKGQELEDNFEKQLEKDGNERRMCNFTCHSSDITSTELDLLEYNFVSVSMRKKTVRRSRLYRNLCDGIKSSWPTGDC